VSDPGKVKLDLLSELTSTTKLPVVDPIEIIGFQFIRENENGVPVRAVVSTFDADMNLYKVMQGDDEVDWITENAIQEALLSRTDDGASNWIIAKILDHKLDGQRYDVQVQWQDGEVSWEPMSVIKKDDPVKLALYAKHRELIYEPGWRWARKMLKTNKRFSRMVKMFKASISEGPKYKFGIRVPRNRKEALQLDKENGNTLWQDAEKAEIALLLEFKTFRILPKGEKTFEGIEKYTYVPLHCVYDIKFDLRRRVRIVAGGNWTNPEDADVFSGVVSIDSVRIGFFSAVLNNLQLCAADIGSAFLHGYTKELIYTRAGPEWGSLEGCLIDRKSVV